MPLTPYLNALQRASTRSDLANLLKVKQVFLTNVLYRIGTENQYKQFQIPKKGGAQRIISAPTDSLKDLQKRIGDYLSNCRQETFVANKIENKLSHGFEIDNSIITNAYRHKGKRTVLNIDLKDFFDSFNFGRVRGYFLHNKDFHLHPIIATTLAKAACFNNSLPQGSPCSPVITNLICNIMDVRLAKLAKKLGCTYSRYADDITFSTNKKSFPEELAILCKDGVLVGRSLKYEIKKAGFDINDAKTRITYKPSRQEVTGLTVNRIVNVDRRYAKKVKALAHTLYKTGSYTVTDEEGEDVQGTLAQLEGMFGFIDQIDKFNNILDKNNKQPVKYALAPVTLKTYRQKLNAREKAYSRFIYFKNFHGNPAPTIVTEGKTDRVYLKSALNSLAAMHPELMAEAKDGEPQKTILNIFKSGDKSSYFLNLSGGTPDIKKFVERYRDEYSSYYDTKAKSPVILILDNDTGPSDLLNFLKNKVKSCPDDVDIMRRMDFLHIFFNLYIILTPLSGSGEFTAMEDLFEHELLKVELDGKKFNKNNDGDSKTEYGKHIFSVRVVRDKKRNVDFKGFNPILERIKMVMEHFRKNNI